MAQDDGRRPAQPALCDAPVWLALLGCLVIALALPWLFGTPAETGARPGAYPWPYLAAAAIGAAVGGAELVSRYRDEPWAAARSAKGLSFILVNAGASILALFLIDHYRGGLGETITAPGGAAGSGLDDPVTRVLVAGFGAMVFLRAKLLTVRQPGGEEVQVGPAFVLDTLLDAVNRDVDRRRSESRLRKVYQMAERLRPHGFNAAAPHLGTALLGLQTMAPEESRRLNERIGRMQSDATQTGLPEVVKFSLIGFDFLTAFGDVAFTTVFDEVERLLVAERARAGG